MTVEYGSPAAESGGRVDFMTRHTLECRCCGREYAEDGYRLECDDCGVNALLRTRYPGTGLPVDTATTGPFRYRGWLPVRRSRPSENLTSVFAAPELGARLGLRDLWVAFTGYWPERDCHAECFSFKELEAIAVLGRRPESAPLVIPSAGNTASAFGLLCTRFELPCLLVVPARQLGNLSLAVPFGPTVQVVALADASYPQTLDYARSLCDRLGVEVEGGVRNVARRDGMATVLYTAYEAMGRLPDHYVQAVGSASGALAAYEASLRLTDGRLPRLLLGQNAEFAPVHELWRDGVTGGRSCPGEIWTPELTNVTPPYHLPGGIAEALRATDGRVTVATTEQARAAAGLFEATYGIDIEPPAAIALACLRQAAASGELPPSDSVLLNITGGGRRRRLRETGAGRRPVAATVLPHDGAGWSVDLALRGPASRIPV
ncbi:cysteate synthase [Nocardia sp. NBC_00511]|uniref:cysteate synthase n=1 Tax=Nocardia sp. NBC_00511 TaxID=2903591 RepID=UPI0030E253A9